MPKLKSREIDYKQSEMLKITNLSRSQFSRKLVRLCDMYGFDIEDFKVETDDSNSEYFFIPEIAELLSVLLRNIDNHPFVRTNANIDNISGTDVKNYYEIILNDIDDELPEYFAKAIFTFEGYLVTQNIVNWMDAFVKQMTRFLVNLTTFKEQDVGKTLKLFTKKLDLANYNLFVGEAIKSTIKNCNDKKEVKRKKGDYNIREHSEINKRLNQSNIGIDNLIAEMIRWYLPKSRAVRDSEFREYSFKNEKILTDILGKHPNECPLYIKREAYLISEINYDLNNRRVENARAFIDFDKADASTWEDTATRISNGDFRSASQKNNDEKINLVKDYIRKLEEELALYRTLLNELEISSEQISEEAGLDDIQKKYVNHCDKIDTDFRSVKKVVNKFVGQAILELLNNTR